MLKVGMKHREQLEVVWDLTADKLGNEGVLVFSTPEMLSFLEKTCRHCVEPLLEEGEGTVGMTVDLKHLASTPIGMHVTCECELIKIDGRRLLFDVKLWDEEEVVGEALHQRYIMPMERLKKTIRDKQERFQNKK